MENEYQTLARCIAQYLHKVDIDVSKTKLTVVVVCQWTLNPRLVKEELERLIEDAKSFLFVGNYSNPEFKEQEGVLRWLESGGILFTVVQQFRGCEADVQILLTGSKIPTSGHRQGLTRGSADLCVISGHKSIEQFISLEELSKTCDLNFYPS